MTGPRLALVLALMLAATLTGTSRAGSAYVPRRAAFVTLTGQGRVTSMPPGISCPGRCRALFPKDALVRLVAHPAPGWALVHFSGSCTARTSACSFNLTSPHDCAGGLCTIGAFGVRVTFARRTMPTG